MIWRTSDVAICCSSASERCPRASASSRVRASSCFFNSISELGPLLTCALAFVPVERSLRPRVGLFAPLRDKVTSSAQPLVPSGQPSVSILTEPRRLIRSPRRPLFAERALRNTDASGWPLVGFDIGRPDHFAPLLGLVGDELTEAAGRARKDAAAEVGKPRLDLGIGEASVDLLV